MSTKPSQQNIPDLIQLKLEAFDRLQPELEASFQFLQDIHGHKRFPAFPVADVVRYLHARWICELKGRLLGVAKTVKEYDGERCLDLLNLWQREGTASVVDFLQHKLDMLPLADITRQYHEARQLSKDDGLARRLEHGRVIMLNRGVNLMQALDAIFGLPEEALLAEVRVACERYNHQSERIKQQLEEMKSPLYSYVPHQVLAQRNMLVMNKMGVNLTSAPSDQPGNRSWRVVPPTEPLSPYAEQVVEGYQELISPTHNNIKQDTFVDRPERSDEGTV
ncbi:MAG: hypothetical protein M3Y39_06240 [Chloroflexota bacterium]|nr:hypothetical protein [Chloroflexota bacterium]